MFPHEDHIKLLRKTERDEYFKKGEIYDCLVCINYDSIEIRTKIDGVTIGNNYRSLKLLLYDWEVIYDESEVVRAPDGWDNF